MNDQKTEANEDERLPAPTGQKHLIPFKLRIHDDDPRHPQGRELGTVWVEIPHDEIAARVNPDIPGQHWEYIAQEQKYAAESICADLSCSIDIDALHSPPNTKTCHGPEAKP